VLSSTEKIAYFDNAATSFPKPECVYRFADEFYRTCGVNVGRGQYTLAAKANALMEDTRNHLLSLYGCANKQVVFSSSATEAINKILFGLSVTPHSNVYISPFEHNAVTRVVHAMERECAIVIRQLPFKKDTLEFDSEKARLEFARYKPDVVIATHASNVCGAILPIEDIFNLAKFHDAVTIVDMSQTAGLIPINLASNNTDYAVFAGHKSLMGPFGIGGFICSKKAQLTPLLFGGTGFDSISQEVADSLRGRMEVGSPNIYAIAGLNAAINWICSQGIGAIRSIESQKTNRLLEILRTHSNVTIIADEMPSERIGVVSTVFDNYSPDEMGMILSGRDIAVRTGLHCSPYAHEFLGTSPNGTVRFSISSLTDDQAFQRLETELGIIERQG